MTQLQKYYLVFKPERTLANVMTTTAGFLFASKLHVDVRLLVLTVLGTTLIVASACAVNNVMDRAIDRRMVRTKRRGLVTGDLSPTRVLMLAGVFGIAGFGLLAAYTNWLTVLIGLVGYIDYVVLYGWAKRHTVHSTLIGTISGSAPIVAGYVAVTGRLDATAVLLGLIMLFWQMTHFFAIALWRRQDYASAGLPVYAVVHGQARTVRQVMLYLLLFIASVVGLVLLSDLGPLALVIMLPLMVRWLWLGFDDKVSDTTVWGRQMFGQSLIVLLWLCVILSVGTLTA